MRGLNDARTSSMYLVCQVGWDVAVKMVSFLGSLGSKAMVLPFSFFLSCAASAEVMFEDVWRTYSRAAVRWGCGNGTEGQRASWMDEG